MKLYLIGNKGIWGDANSHPLPLTIKVIPFVEIGSATINGCRIGLANSEFTIKELREGFNTVEINGISCERLMCVSQSGVQRAHAIGDASRECLPLIERITSLEEAVARHESTLKNQDFFA